MSGILEGKVAIITGGSKGIGGATAELFVKEGAFVVITSRGKDALMARVEELKAMGGNVLGIVADASSSIDFKKVFERTLKEFGKLDILVNNAGTSNTLGIDKTTDEEWSRVIAINQSSVFYGCREAINYMLPRNSGAIINVASTNGIRPLSGFAYCVSKFAVIGITRSVALRLFKTNVRCNCVCPGPTNTAMAEAFYSGQIEIDEVTMAMMSQKIDLNVPPAESMEQANSILFLASDAASAVNGAVFEVDKGSYI